MASVVCDSRGEALKEVKVKPPKTSDEKELKTSISQINADPKQMKKRKNKMKLWIKQWHSTLLEPIKERREVKHDERTTFKSQTTVVGGMTTVGGGVTAIHDREDDDFSEKIMQEIMALLQDEKLIKTKFKLDGKVRRKDKARLKIEADEYCQLEGLIGEDMMNVLCETKNLNGTNDFKMMDAPTCKPKQLKRADDPAYELQWM